MKTTNLPKVNMERGGLVNTDGCKGMMLRKKGKPVNGQRPQRICRVPAKVKSLHIKSCKCCQNRSARASQKDIPEEGPFAEIKKPFEPLRRNSPAKQRLK